MRMQKESVNMYEIWRQLGIVSVRMKIEMRALYRFCHVLRMPNDRLTKKVVLGRWFQDREDAGCMKNSIVFYWRRLMLEAGEDWTLASYLARDKKRWKSVLRAREARMGT